MANIGLFRRGSFEGPLSPNLGEYLERISVEPKKEVE
jgi:hypothetical protein